MLSRRCLFAVVADDDCAHIFEVNYGVVELLAGQGTKMHRLAADGFHCTTEMLTGFQDELDFLACLTGKDGRCGVFGSKGDFVSSHGSGGESGHDSKDGECFHGIEDVVMMLVGWEISERLGDQITKSGCSRDKRCDAKSIMS